MKKNYFLLSVLSLSFSCGLTHAQDQLSRDYAPIKTELQSWDPVRGEWLAESMLAISKNQPIPDRTFPEDFTPSEMLKMVPANNRQHIQNTIEANRTSQSGSLNGDVWNRMSTFVQAPSCQLVSGRSYGDPHLSSFDGKAFSFQTVGEFILAKSLNGNVQVQTRQRADGDDFSLNTAVAMYVAGDRVCIYADEKPDADFSNPLRVDGQSIRMNGGTYYLAHGGNIRNTGNKYVVTWPTGENVTCEITNRSKFGFMNVTTQIYPCIPGGYEGLLGNANGIADDDINTRNNRYDYASANRFNTVFGGQTATMSNEAEKEYLVYLSKEFGQAWRVNPMTSLFDYGPGQSSEYFTDYTFPRYHRTVRDLNPNQRENARRECERNGITGNDLDGCIFDQAYVGIPPSRKPDHRDPTEGVVLTTIDRNKVVRNINPPLPTGTGPVKPATSAPVKPVTGSTGTAVKNPGDAPAPVVISKPVGDGPMTGTKQPESKKPETKKPETTVSAPIKETKSPVSEPVKPARESKPVNSTPVKENKPVISTPVKETKPAPVKVEKPKETKVTTPSQSSGSIPAPVRTSTPTIKSGR